MNKDNGPRPINEIDPRDPNLTDAEKRMIMVRCQNDPAYFLEKVVGIRPLVETLTALREAISRPPITFKPYSYQPLNDEKSGTGFLRRHSFATMMALPITSVIRIKEGTDK